MRARKTTKLLVVLLLALPAVAFAQESPHEATVQPDVGGTTHSDPNLGGVQDEHAGTHTGTHEDSAHADHVDPTQHFNYTNFSYRGKDVMGGKFGDGVMTDPKTGKVVGHGEEAMAPPFVLMLLNFGLLLLILGKYGAPAARKLAQERHDQIKLALDEAAKLRDQAQAKLTEYETRIKDVDAEVKKLVEGIRADAEADKQRILQAAAAQAAQMKRDAEQRIAAEIELARAQLTKEVTVAAAGATEKLLRDKVTADDQNKLVGTFIATVGTSATKEAR